MEDLKFYNLGQVQGHSVTMVLTLKFSCHLTACIMLQSFITPAPHLLGRAVDC